MHSRTMPFSSLALIICSFCAFALAQNKTIRWYSCKQNATVPFTCGTLQVPLDYSDPTNRSILALDLVRVSAVKQPKKGSILFNPGGPGSSGRDLVVGPAAEALLIATGGHYDLIGFDTRGTGKTIPFTCFSDEDDRQDWESQFPGNLNVSDTAPGTIWALSSIYARSCGETARGIGSLIGTAFVARDMMQIVDALNEDGLLRYWGFSYGTLLGATVAAMFPNRMDKIVLDGVANPFEYYAGQEVQSVTDTDAVLAGFFKGCIANPRLCALATDGSTAEELSKKLYDRLYAIKYEPIPAGLPTLPLTIDYATVKSWVFDSLYSIDTWPILAKKLHGVISGNLSMIVEANKATATNKTGSTFPNGGLDANQGIRCGDSTYRTKNFSDLQQKLPGYYKKSMLLGDRLLVGAFTCAQWPFAAKERYTGNFHVQTRNPVLVIGNTYDPITPLISARNLSAALYGSVVLQHDGYGHTSLAQASLCTAKIVRAYFNDGTLPSPGTICPVDVPLFSNRTLNEVFEQLPAAS